MFHVVGGIRHLIMDAGYLESKSVAVVTSWLSFILTVLAMVPVIYWVI
jgi:succinate dehydrogenase/fumarate reductase cytochrome b subunit